MHTEYQFMLLALLICHVTGKSLEDDPETDNIKKLMISNETQTFLESFPNLNQREVLDHQLRYCPFSDLCGYSLPLRKRFQFTLRPCCETCSCDVTTCHLYNTCCPDIEKLPSNSTLEFGQTAMECHLMHLSKKIKFKQKSIFMSTSCPKGSNKTVQQLCRMSYDERKVSHFSHIVPVTHKNDGRIYKNKFCAFCNNVSEKEIQYWYPRLSCNYGHTIDIAAEGRIITDILGHENCDLKFEPEHEVNMEECTMVNSSCNETGLWKTYDPFLEEACSFYRTPHKLSRIIATYYGNVFCMLCNGLEPSDYKCLRGSTNPTDVPSFSALLNFGYFADSQKKYEPGQCGSGAIFDPYQSSCKDLFCSAERKLRNGECFKLHPKIGLAIYDAYVRVTPEDDLTIHTAYAMASEIITWLRLHIPTLFPDPPYEHYDCSRQLVYAVDLDATNDAAWRAAIEESVLLYYDVKVQFLEAGLHDPDAILQELSALENMSKVFIFNNKTITFTLSFRDDTGYSFDHYLNVTIDKYMNKATYKVNASLSDMMSEAKPSVDNGKIIFPHLYLSPAYTRCLSTKLQSRKKLSTIRSCPMLNVSYRQFENEYTADGILFVKRGFLLRNSDFYYTGDSTDHIGVCSETYFKFAEHLQADKAFDVESVVDIVCVSVSICSLLLTTVTFVLFPQLRTVPGQNNIFLVVSLVIAQSMYLIGSVGSIPLGSVACKVVGIAVHFFWLHYVCWMHVCTVYTFNVCFKAKHVNESNSERLCAHHVYSTLVPILIVVLNITLSMSSSDYEDIGYGETICFISFRNMTEYTLGIPVAMVALSNAVMFLFAVCTIKISNQTQKVVKYAKQNLVILVKLTTLTGLTWAFSFIYSWTNVAIFSYIFIGLNASQGLFLLLSFVLNKPVLDMYFKKVFDVLTYDDNSGHNE